MNLLLELQQRRSALSADMRALHVKTVEEKRAFTEDEQTAYDAKKAERAQVDAMIERERELAGDERSAAGDAANRDGHGGGGDESGEVFGSLGEQIQAVIRAADPAQRMDPRLIEQRSITGMGTQVPSDGGFVVQKDFASTLITPIHETGAIASRVRRIPMSSNANGLKIPRVNETSRANGSRWGGIRAYWAAEGGTLTASAPKLQLLELDLKKLIGLVYLTDELIQDASALEAIVRQGFQEEFTFKFEDAVINGTGQGQPLGILNSPSLVTQAIEGSETIANSAGYMGLNLTKMWSRLLPSSKRNSVWLCNPDILPKIYTARTDASAGAAPVFLPAGGISGNQYNTILGRPVIENEYCAAEGTPGDLILADLSSYIAIDKGGMQQASSIHVRFLNDEQVLRFIWRVDGQPRTNSALTPYKGSNTKSPFVALATRA